MLSTIYKIYSNTNLKLEFNLEIYNAFEANMRVKQGFSLSLLLFSIMIDDLGTDLDNKSFGN